MDKTTNSINWFEIPAKDIQRAKKFYEKVFAIKMDTMPEMMGMKMAGFPSEMGNGKASGAIAQRRLNGRSGWQRTASTQSGTTATADSFDRSASR